jgi:uncharacterized membrane protein YeiH
MLSFLYLAAIWVFAATGVLAGGRKGMDVVSIVIIGTVTALGGGTVRDILLSSPQIFWIAAPAYLWSAAAASLLIFFVVRIWDPPFRVFLMADAAATAMFTATTTGRLIETGLRADLALIMGVITGVAGGLIRDMLLNSPPLLLRRDFFIGPCLLGAGLQCLILFMFPEWSVMAALCGMLLIFALRVASIQWKLYYPDALLYQAGHTPDE